MTGAPLLAALALCVPVFLLAVRGRGYGFPMPLLVVGGGWCAFAALYTPPLYAMGASAVPRMENLFWLAWVFLVLGGGCYLAGWVSVHLPAWRGGGAGSGRFGMRRRGAAGRRPGDLLGEYLRPPGQGRPGKPGFGDLPPGAGGAPGPGGGPLDAPAPLYPHERLSPVLPGEPAAHLVLRRAGGRRPPPTCPATTPAAGR